MKSLMLLIAGVGILSAASLNPIWEVVHRVSDEDNFFKIIRDADGNRIAIGYTRYGGPYGGYDIVVVKKSPYGFIQWIKYLGTSGYDEGRDIVIDGNGNYIGAGSKGGKFFVFKLMPSGDTIWTRTFDRGDWGKAFAISIDNEGYYIVAGLFEDGSDNQHPWVLKLNPNTGDTVWSKSFDSDYSSYLWYYGFFDITITSDNHYILMGELNDEGFIVKMTSEGDTVWTRSYPAEIYYEGTFLRASIDHQGNLVIAGCWNTESEADGWLVKLDLQTGDTFWTRVTEYYDVNQIEVDGSGNYIFVGGDNWSRLYPLIFKVDTGGTITDTFLYPELQYVEFNSLTLEGDTIFVAGGGYNKSSFAFIGILTENGTLLEVDTMDFSDTDHGKRITFADNGYLIGGWTSSHSDYTGTYLLKFSPEGDIEWTKYYVSSSSNFALVSMKKLSDTLHLLLIQNTGAYGSPFPVLYKIGRNGNNVWSREYSSFTMFPRDLEVDRDGNYLILGDGFEDITPVPYLLKINPNTGDTIWTRKYHVSDYATEIKIGRDGNYVMLGHNQSATSGEGIILTKIDRNSGDTIWTKEVPLPDTENTYYPRSFEIDSEGMYVIGGSRYGSGSHVDNAWLAKFDADLGDTLWFRIYNPNEYGMVNRVWVDTIREVYGIVGEMGNRGYIAVIDPCTGDIGDSAYLSSDNSTIADIIIDSEGHYLLTGSIMAVEDWDIWVLKLEGGLSSLREINNISKLSTNMFLSRGGRLALHFSVPLSAPLELSIYGIDGRRYRSLNLPKGRSIYHLDLNLKAGIYIIRLGTRNYKLLVE